MIKIQRREGNAKFVLHIERWNYEQALRLIERGMKKTNKMPEPMQRAFRVNLISQSSERKLSIY